MYILNIATVIKNDRQGTRRLSLKVIINGRDLLKKQLLFNETSEKERSTIVYN